MWYGLLLPISRTESDGLAGVGKSPKELMLLQYKGSISKVTHLFKKETEHYNIHKGNILIFREYVELNLKMYLFWYSVQYVI